MLKTSGQVLITVLACIAFLGCSGSAPVGDMSPLTGVVDLATLERAAEEDNTTMLTPQRYREVRNAYVDEMSALLAEREKQSGSLVRKGKNLVASLGALMGLGGTVASYTVNNDDTKQSIAQTSALVASVSAVVALVPLGNPPKGAAETQKYLRLEIPAFQARWPVSPAAPLDVHDWRLFLSDIRRTEALLDAFGR